MDSMEEVSEWTKYLWDFSVLCKRFFFVITLLWLIFLSKETGWSCARVSTTTSDLSSNQEDVCWSCENSIWYCVWTESHWGTPQTVSSGVKSPHKVPKVVSQSVLLAMLTCFWHFTKWSGRLCSRVVNLLSRFQTPVWSDGWPRKRAWCEWHDGGQGHEENGDGSSSSPNSVNVGGNRLAED